MHNGCFKNAVFNEFTKTDVVLVSPAVTSDDVSRLEDRTPDDIANNLPGYVFRTITPDYIQAQMLARIAANRLDPAPLVRFEDQILESECTTEVPTFCANAFPDDRIECLASRQGSETNREFFRFSDTACAGTAAGFCDTLGNNYECIADPESGADVCAQFRIRRYCTKIVRPRHRTHHPPKQRVW